MSRAILQFLQDLRYASRQLRRAPGFTASILLVLGLGIGANAAIFSILNVTLLRQLPYAQPGELVTLQPSDMKGDPVWSTLPDLEEWQKQTRTLNAIAYFDIGKAYLDTPAGQQHLSATEVSANLLSTLGVQPALGRGFTDQDQEPGKSNVVLISHDLWQSHFNADPNIVGRSVPIDGVPTTVLGVMPRGFLFPQDGTSEQLWKPFEINPLIRSRTSNLSEPSQYIGRLRPNVDAAAAQNDLSAIQKRLTPLYVGSFAERFAASQVKVSPYRAGLDRKDRPALLALLAAVGLIWLIACANAANLMLARSSARRREIGLRMALGADRGDILNLMFKQATVLVAVGIAVGIALSLTTTHLLEHFLFGTKSRDAATFVAAAALMAAVSLFAAWLPARRAAAIEPMEALRTE
jgi:hypothetical protein